jgi:phage tail-like protein
VSQILNAGTVTNAANSIADSATTTANNVTSTFVNEDNNNNNNEQAAPQPSFAEKEAEDQLFYPHLTNKFWLDIDYDITGFFTELSGLSAETEVEYISEGGNNNYRRAIPTRTKYSNLVLKRGWGTNPKLWYWYFGCTAAGKPSPKNLTLYMYSADTPGVPVVTLFFYNAWPVRWKGPDLKASDGNNFAIEEVEIFYEYFDSLTGKLGAKALL